MKIKRNLLYLCFLIGFARLVKSDVLLGINNTIYCKDPTRFGNEFDGGKILCGLGKEILENPNCIVYSIGSNNDFSFEEAVLKNTKCSVWTFDCTLANKKQKLEMRAGRHYFYPCKRKCTGSLETLIPLLRVPCVEK
jgi:hypothetical protein